MDTVTSRHFPKSQHYDKKYELLLTNQGRVFIENLSLYIFAPDCSILEPTTWASLGFDYDFVMAVNGDVAPIPEPATMLLLGTGLVGVAGAARRKKKK